MLQTTDGKTVYVHDANEDAGVREDWLQARLNVGARKPGGIAGAGQEVGDEMGRLQKVRQGHKILANAERRIAGERAIGHAQAAQDKAAADAEAERTFAQKIMDGLAALQKMCASLVEQERAKKQTAPPTQPAAMAALSGRGRR